MKTKVRFGVAFSLFVLFLVAYFDRSNITLLIADEQFLNDLGISGNHSAQGLLMTFFLLPYALGNFIMGPLSDKLGGRRMLFIIYIIWGVVMCLMGIIPILSVMLFFRGVLGVSEAPVTPVTTQLIGRWFPPNERTMANSAWTFGLLLAPAIAIPTIGIIISYFGWQISFFIIGIVGVIIPVILTYFFLYDSPNKHPRITKEERDYIIGDYSDAPIPASNTSASSKSLAFLRNVDFWLICVMYILGNGIIWGLTTWFPTYIHDTFHLDIASSGFYSALPYIASIVLMIIISPLVDRAKTKAWGLIVGTVMAAISMILSVMIGTGTAVAITLAFAVGASYMQSPIIFNLIQRIVPPERTATAGGILNGAGYLLGASSAPLVFGYLVDVTDSFTTGFVVMIVMSLVLITISIYLFFREKRLPAKAQNINNSSVTN